MTEAVLKINELSVSFPNFSSQITVVRKCSLDVGKGEILGLVGESGSGKSMTAMSCLGLVPKPGVAIGSVNVAGHEVVGANSTTLNQLRGGISGMIFQNPMTALNPFISIGDQFNDAIQSSTSVSRKSAHQKALSVLESVYIPNPAQALKKYPHQLSGGQLQRIMIAMVVACKPQLLIADEPTTALDVTIQAQVLLLIRELALKNQLAILFITHDLSVVATICDRVAVMYAGSIVETGDVVDVFANPAHPYTRKLLQTVPAIGKNKNRLEFIPGQVPDMSNLPSGCAFQSRCETVMDKCRIESPTETTLNNLHRVVCHFPLNQRERTQ
ncbi:MAG: ABC transporter ATP-binding protein [Desulfuromusa sp.]|nr:ABC transporter ATP-binding protein [Desulfuromusa sp.]